MEPDHPGVRSPRTGLVGRETELEAIIRALGEARLVTVTGLGGTGKTRLAVEVADRLAPTRREGARVVGLAPVATVDGIVTILTHALNPSASPSAAADPLTRVAAAARPHDLLLVIDNCEHVLSDVAWIADRLLDECPQLTVLATSREPLRITGESVVAIGPLPVEPCTLQRPSPAVELFATRAAATRHNFQLDATNLDDVITICRAVDGIPLAIELAAAHVDHLSSTEIAQRLEERPGLLVSRDRAAAARHRTLTATLDWSYRLLSAAEQQMLRSLALFLDGAPADGVAAVCNLDEDAARDLIRGLTDKNLVVTEQRAGISHYRLLDTVRRYALRHLEAAGDVQTVRHRQATWIVERSTPDAASRNPSAWTVAGDGLADLIAVLTWAVEAGETTLALSLAGTSWRAWEMTGRHAEGRRLLAEVLAADSDAPSPERAQVRIAAAHLAFVAGELPSARHDYEQAVAELRSLGADAGLAAALTNLATSLLFEGDIDGARDLAHEALDRSQRLDDAGGAAFAHTSLAMIAARCRRFDEAEWHFLEALQRFRRLGLRREAASVLDNLGNLAADLGQPGRAHRYYEGALQLQQRVGDHRGTALSLNNLCLVAQQRGNLDGAWEYAETARQLFHEVGDRAGEAATVNNLANLASERGQVAQSMELYGECIGSFREMGDPRRLATALQNLADLARSVDERQMAWDCLLDATSLWNRLGEHGDVRNGLTALRRLAATWGVAADILAATAGDEDDPMVIAHALESARWAPVPEPSRPAHTATAERLTAREQQVAGLVGKGMTNAEIATELFISDRTVESHVSNARTKLRIDSRTKLTRWAIEHGLASLELQEDMLADIGASRRPLDALVQPGDD